jgi:predicted  nucleic acid-binding Zn-ribbon protein
VPEILEMLKQYKKAVDKGWTVEPIMEWGLLQQKEREAFRELCTKAYSEEGVSPSRYLPALKAAMENLKEQKDRLSKEIGELNQKRDTSTGNIHC